MDFEYKYPLDENQLKKHLISFLTKELEEIYGAKLTDADLFMITHFAEVQVAALKRLDTDVNGPKLGDDYEEI